MYCQESHFVQEAIIWIVEFDQLVSERREIAKLTVPNTYSSYQLPGPIIANFFFGLKRTQDPYTLNAALFL
ncbi:hypothetical protein DSO57_1016599 [Entomophthora muscae]|uniref:Uncharacterized protein n=1 Tax=Entomophthora muscae TaxID=34485 RepID=A0ACC2SI48_9FUNG|nr:hypothetical protein DSO57_1016599 [Entomophthora muscae]